MNFLQNFGGAAAGGRAGGRNYLNPPQDPHGLAPCIFFNISPLNDIFAVEVVVAVDLEVWIGAEKDLVVGVAVDAGVARREIGVCCIVLRLRFIKFIFISCGAVAGIIYYFIIINIQVKLI
jgi:hypothetical protein